MREPVRVLFVCTGNICRSPMAQGMFETQIERAGISDRVEADSAGTHDFHVGEEPDPRAQEATGKREVAIGRQRARQIEMKDFSHFDYIVVMDKHNLDLLRYLCPDERRDQLHLLLEYAPDHKQREVPDPYQGDNKAFDRVLNMIEAGCLGLVDDIRQRFP